MKFPVKIIKGDSEYTVRNQAELDFHLNQGWELAEIPSTEDDEAPAPSVDMKMIDKRFVAMAKRLDDALEQITALKSEVDALKLTVDAQIEVMATLTAAPPAADEPAPLAEDGK